MSDCRKVFLNNLFYLMGQRKWTIARLSIEGDVSFSTISNFLYSSENMPKVETIEKISGAFGLSVSDMLDPSLTEQFKTRESLKNAYAETARDMEKIERALIIIKASIEKGTALLETKM